MIDRLANYDVTWDSPSKDSSGSMPLGNGDIGLNVWVEGGGDIVLLVGKTDAWDENAINLKLGRIRVKILPVCVGEGRPFRQTLHLKTGEIEIVADGVTIRIWVDANQPVVQMEARGAAAFEMTASLECWRTEPRRVKTQTSDLYKNLTGKDSDPYPTVVWPDEILKAKNDRIVWRHRNEKREPDAYEVNLKLQGLGHLMEDMPHPLLWRTFGAAMEGSGFVAVDDVTLKSAAATGHRLGIYPLTVHPATSEQWGAELEKTIGRVSAVDAAEARKKHEDWWEQFWERSWIYVEQAFELTRAYLLQRFMTAAGGRGKMPIKHNGGLFSVGADGDPDSRRWGSPGWWFQNQRLIYWPMLANGDWDLMMPWFAMYRDSLPMQRERTRTYFGHGGAHYPETITFWGSEISSHYGWTPFEQRKRPEAECAYLTYYWSGGIELTAMMCEYFAYSGDEKFVRQVLMPVAEGVMEFFDLHYPRDGNGKIRFEPGQALETWHEAVNPTPEIAGLRYVLGKLLRLPGGMGTEQARERWRRMLGELPEIPTGTFDGKRRILPAERFDKKKNCENPELYAVFPYRVFGIGKPDLELARETFAARLNVSQDCWSQDEIQAALLGLTEEAKEGVIHRASPAAHSDSRFPGFWNQFHDWIPDMDHGGVLQLALQLMLIQVDAEEIRWLVAWPKEWDAEFKLCVPWGKIVQGRVRGGQVEARTLSSGILRQGAERMPMGRR